MPSPTQRAALDSTAKREFLPQGTPSSFLTVSQDSFLPSLPLPVETRISSGLTLTPHPSTHPLPESQEDHASFQGSRAFCCSDTSGSSALE